MPLVRSKYEADSSKVSNKITFRVLSRRDRQALARLVQEAEDDGDKNLEISVDKTDAEGFAETILISIEA